MASKLQLTYAGYLYDRSRPLVEGRVTIDGVDLIYITDLLQPERQWRMTRWQEFDCCEFSLSSYLAMKSRGAPLVAVPVFPYRKFRHGFVFINTTKGIKSPRDLEGKKIGLRNWQVTAGLWARGILGSEYGVDLRKIEWFTHDNEDVPFDPAPGFRISRIAPGADMDGMLASGELDGLVYPRIPTCYHQGDPRVARLFPDYKTEEIRYYQRTGIFPIMHVLVFREDLVARYPWVPREVMKAFQKAKEYALHKLDDTRELTLAWAGEEVEAERAIFGRDPMPFGFAANRQALETVVGYSLDQGLMARQMAWEELFFPPSLDETKQGYISPSI